MIGANVPLAILSSTMGEPDAEGVVMRSYQTTDVVVGNFHQKTATEIVNGSYQVVERWVAFLPPFVVIDHTSLIEVEDGTRYRVETVAERRGPSGLVHHITATCIKAGA